MVIAPTVPRPLEGLLRASVAICPFFACFGVLTQFCLARGWVFP